jgi:hypothetical protein
MAFIQDVTLKIFYLGVIFASTINKYKKAGYHPHSWQPHGRLYPKTARKRPRKATWGRTWAKAQIMPMNEVEAFD